MGKIIGYIINESSTTNKEVEKMFNIQKRVSLDYRTNEN